MTTTIPTDWPQVSWADFAKFLAACPDYKRTAYIDGELYYFNRSQELFAADSGNIVYVRPDLLQPA